MSTSNFVGRVGALAVALGVGFAVTVAPGVPLAESVNPPDTPPPDRIALILGGTTIPTPDDYMVKLSMNQYIAPTHHGEYIDPVKVTAPQELWPLTGRAHTQSAADARRADIAVAIELAHRQGATLFELRTALNDFELRGYAARAALGCGEWKP